MGFIEAKEDGIEYKENSYTRNTQYYPKCHICGNKTMSFNYVRGYKYTCQACKDDNFFSDKEMRLENNRDIKERKFRNAVSRIHSHVMRPERYSKAVEAIYKYLHRDGWFDSTEEIMVAIELCKNGIKFSHQVKFGKYRADFVLPDEKVVLEVDGTMFHTKATRGKETARDNLIVLALGPEWEVVRITDKQINEDIRMLVKAIRHVKKRRTELRKAYDGALPKWYSDRDI